MIDFLLNAVAKIYTNAADREIEKTAEYAQNGDYEQAADHIANAINLLDYRDHEILGEPYSDNYAEVV